MPGFSEMLQETSITYQHSSILTLGVKVNVSGYCDPSATCSLAAKLIDNVGPIVCKVGTFYQKGPTQFVPSTLPVTTTTKLIPTTTTTIISPNFSKLATMDRGSNDVKQPSDFYLNMHRFNDGFGNIGLQVIKTVEDVERWAKWTITPKGLLFNIKQGVLQRFNARRETRIYNPLGLFASIPPYIHAPRHTKGSFIDVNNPPKYPDDAHLTFQFSKPSTRDENLHRDRTQGDGPGRVMRNTKVGTLPDNTAEGGTNFIDGRDIGSKVFKNAKIKLFVNVNVEIRAKRRHKQLIEQGEKSIYSRILKDMELRDKQDKTRKISPMVAPTNAFIIDNSKSFKFTRKQIHQILFNKFNLS